jgi:regulator of RNase E activity RraA
LRSSKSGKSGAGERDIPVSVGGVTINAGDLVTSDDGIVVRPSSPVGFHSSAWL